MDLTTPALAAIAGALVAGVSAWIGFAGRVVTYSKLERIIAPISNDAKAATATARDALRQTDAIVPLEKIDQRIQETAPWSKDRHHITARLSTVEDRTAKVADVMTDILSRLTRIETKLDTISGNK